VNIYDTKSLRPAVNIFDKFTAPNIPKLEEKKDKEGLKAALTYKDAAIRLAALQALARLSDIETIYSVYKGYTEDKALQAAALTCIRNCSGLDLERIVDALTNETQRIKPETAKELAGLIGAPIVAVILKRYFQQIRDRSVYWLPEAIKAVGAPAVDPLIATCNETLSGPHRNLAANIIEALGRLHDPRVADYMFSLLNRPMDLSDLSNRRIMEKVIDNLAVFKEKRTVEPLIEILQDKTKHSDLRRTAAYTLGQIGDERAVEPLLNALEDDDKRVQPTVAGALSQPGFNTKLEPTIEKLLAKLNSNDSSERKNAIGLLGGLKTARAFEAIRPFLEDEDADICGAASTALNNIDKEKAQAQIKALCAASHKFGETRMGARFEELITRCMRCGYEKKEPRRCKNCGGIQFELVRDDWNDTRYSVCTACRTKVD